MIGTFNLADQVRCTRMKWPRFPNVSDPLPNPLPASRHRTAASAPAQSDRALLERIQLRDQNAMAGIFDRYSGMAYAVALRVLGDSAQAEDVIQDIFLQVWLNPSAFVPERGSLGAWLAVVTRNRAIDAIRRRKPSEPVDDVVLPAATDIASEVERAATVERVRSVLSRMPLEQRETVELAFFQGLTHSEIAREKGEPLGTVKTRIRAALISLRKALQP